MPTRRSGAPARRPCPERTSPAAAARSARRRSGSACRAGRPRPSGPSCSARAARSPRRPCCARRRCRRAGSTPRRSHLASCVPCEYATNRLVEPAVITELLRKRLDPALECVAVERGPMGNSQETWFIDARDAEGVSTPLVLRRSSARGTLEHTDRRAEFELLGALAAHGFPVPRVHWLEEEPSTLERPYFVMDRLPGGPLRRQTPEQRAALGRELGSWLARLHAADPDALAPALERPVSAADATRAELARWQAEYERSRPGPVPLLGAMLAWLEVNVPEAEAPVRLLWADAGPHNLLVVRRPDHGPAGLGARPPRRPARGPRGDRLGLPAGHARARRRARGLRGEGRPGGPRAPALLRGAGLRLALGHAAGRRAGLPRRHRAAEQRRARPAPAAGEPRTRRRARGLGGPAGEERRRRRAAPGRPCRR